MDRLTDWGFRCREAFGFDVGRVAKEQADAIVLRKVADTSEVGDVARQIDAIMDNDMRYNVIQIIARTVSLEQQELSASI